MKKRWTALFISIILAVSMMLPAYAADLSVPEEAAVEMSAEKTESQSAPEINGEAAKEAAVPEKTEENTEKEVVKEEESPEKPEETAGAEKAEEASPEKAAETAEPEKAEAAVTPEKSEDASEPGNAAEPASAELAEGVPEQPKASEQPEKPEQPQEPAAAEPVEDVPEQPEQPEVPEEQQEAVLEEEAKTFSDVTNTKAGYYEPVYWATGKGIVAGFNDGTFRPNDTCTRGQIVMFLWRMAGKPEPDSWYCDFNDVSDTHPYRKAIMWANENGIAQGYSNGTFKPDDPCTRGHIVTFLWRYKGWQLPKSGTTKFSDVPKTHSYFKAISWASENGIAMGFNDGTFRMNDRCTRGQCVTFLYRTAQKMGTKYIIATDVLLILNSSPITVTKGFTATININRSPAVATDTLTYTSSNTAIATVTNKGVIKGVAIGSAKITVSSPNGKKAAITVKVIDNVGYWGYSTDVYDYTYGEPELAPIKTYYSGGKLVMEAYVMNNRMFTAESFDYITINIYDLNHKPAASKTFKNVSLNIAPYSKIKKKFTFENPKVIDMNEEMFFDYDYYYNYLIG